MKTGVERFRQDRASPEEIARLEREVGQALRAPRGAVSDDDLPEGEVLPAEDQATIAYGLTRRRTQP